MRDIGCKKNLDKGGCSISSGAGRVGVRNIVCVGVSGLLDKGIQCRVCAGGSARRVVCAGVSGVSSAPGDERGLLDKGGWTQSSCRSCYEPNKWQHTEIRLAPVAIGNDYSTRILSHSWFSGSRLDLVWGMRLPNNNGLEHNKDGVLRFSSLS